MIELSMYHYLALGLMLFIIGIAGSVICKNVIKVLISIEIMLTGVNINFVAFSSYCGAPAHDGFIFILFYTGIGAVEIAVAIYIFYLMYKKKMSDSIDNYGDL